MVPGESKLNCVRASVWVSMARASLGSMMAAGRSHRVRMNAFMYECACFCMYVTPYVYMCLSSIRAWCSCVNIPTYPHTSVLVYKESACTQHARQDSVHMHLDVWIHSPYWPGNTFGSGVAVLVL